MNEPCPRCGLRFEREPGYWTGAMVASYALGVPRWRTVVSVVLPTASAGITTGIVLAIARVTGETAPLLVTAFGFDAIKTSPFKGPQSNLSLYVFQNASSAFDVAVRRAWGAALSLIIVVLALIAIARLLGRLNRVPAHR